MTAEAVRYVGALKKPEGMSEQLTDALRKRNTLIRFSTANVSRIFLMSKKNIKKPCPGIGHGMTD